MIDLHTHSLLSDGVFIPAELVQRAAARRYQTIGITDHVDHSNLEHTLSSITRICEELNKVGRIKVIPGVEITHVPPKLIPNLVEQSRKLGAKIIVVHGETIVEPVPPGTNSAALDCDIDILAHPGLINRADVKKASSKKIHLEISGRKGHCFTNGHVARLAIELDAPLIFNTDAHSDEDLMNRDQALQVLKGAGLTDKDSERVLDNAGKLIKKL